MDYTCLNDQCNTYFFETIEDGKVVLMDFLIRGDKNRALRIQSDENRNAKEKTQIIDCVSGNVLYRLDEILPRLTKHNVVDVIQRLTIVLTFQ